MFYDARADKDKRYTQFSTPASLAVPCKLVNLHGYSVEDEQMRIPFVVWGEPTQWYEPLGLADIRGQLIQNMVLMVLKEISGSRPQILADASRRVLQHIGSFGAPRLPAWRSLEGQSIYDFWNDTTITGNNGKAGISRNQSGLSQSLKPLIWDWEAAMQQQLPSSPKELEKDRKYHAPH